MRAMPRASHRPRIPVAGAPADSESRQPPDPVSARGIARMARSYDGDARIARNVRLIRAPIGLAVGGNACR